VVLFFTSRRLVASLLTVVCGPQSLMGRGSSDCFGEGLPHSVVGVSTPHCGGGSKDVKCDKRGQNGECGAAACVLLRSDRSRNRRGRVSRIPDWLCRRGD
jgi:hypothetical protein